MSDRGDTVVKRDPAPLEAAGLRWLAAAGARVPDIVRDEPDRLELRRIGPGRLDAAGEEDLGRMLATMHRAGADRFGSQPASGRMFVGRCELPSAEGDDWAQFYRDHRLRPLAQRVGLADRIDAVRIEAPDEGPARLHGDLWTGNVLADRNGRPWLIDPAAYGGHREMDLAMLDLFGSIPSRTAAAYEEVAPLAPGWRERVQLWQLFPVLVHADLFGGGYLHQADDLIRQLSR